jgi:RNA polymerase sigma-70 factor (ECF subfamily)
MKQGEPEELMRSFLKHERPLLRFILGFVPSLADAQDVLQETAVTLWKKRDEFDLERPFLPWACGVARFKIREFWKKQPRWEAFDADELMALLESRREAMKPELSAREARLQECLGKLAKSQHGVLVGYYIEREGVETIAAREGKTVAAIYKLLQRIRQTLLKCVERGLKAETI